MEGQFLPTICAHCNTPESVCNSYALMKEPANWRSFLSGRTWMGPVGGHRLFVGDNPRYNWQSLADSTVAVTPPMGDAISVSTTPGPAFSSPGIPTPHPFLKWAPAMRF